MLFSALSLAICEMLMEQTTHGPLAPIDTGTIGACYSDVCVAYWIDEGFCEEQPVIPTMMWRKEDTWEAELNYAADACLNGALPRFGPALKCDEIIILRGEYLEGGKN